MPYSEPFMLEAIGLSKEKMEAGEGGPFGAVVVKSGEVVGRGWNRVTSANDPTAHAEIEAIRDACTNLDAFSLAGCEIYSSCEPCPMCLAAIYWARLDVLYFAASRNDAAHAGFDDVLIYEEISKPIMERKMHAEQHLAKAAQVVMAGWRSNPNKQLY